MWIGAIGGAAWRETPLPVAFCSNCIFRSGVLQALNASGINWEMAVDSELDNAVEAAVSADLAVHVALEGNLPPHTEVIHHAGNLPDLTPQKINLYVLKPEECVSAAMADIIRRSYAPAASLPKVITA